MEITQVDQKEMYQNAIPYYDFWDGLGVAVVKLDSLEGWEAHLDYVQLLYSNSSGVYICKSIVNYLRHGNYICKSEGIHLLCTDRFGRCTSSQEKLCRPGVYICNSIVNYLRLGNYICKSERYSPDPWPNQASWGWSENSHYFSG